MPTPGGPSRQAIGRHHEQAAAAYLQRQGLKLLHRNFRCRYGEIDLIFQDSDTLVFTEVRYRSQDQFGGAVASVNPGKQRRLIQAARWYLSQQPGTPNCRFDVIAIGGPQSTLEWIKDAFWID